MHTRIQYRSRNLGCIWQGIGVGALSAFLATTLFYVGFYLWADNPTAYGMLAFGGACLGYPLSLLMRRG
jgi:hypothetical protein